MKILKFLLCFSFYIFHFSLTYGQSWDWGKQGRGNYYVNDNGSPVATDKSGNAYIAGEYNAIIIFGNDTLTSASENAYMVKYNAAGTLIWTRQLIDSTGGSSGTSVATDKSGNIYLTGYFYGYAKIGSFTLTSPTGSTTFLAKYNANGTALWAKQAIIPSGICIAEPTSVTTDKKGNIFLTGGFTDTVSFGSYTLKAPLLYMDNTFLVKYDSNGNVLWAQQSDMPPGSSGLYAQTVIADNLGNAYITGGFATSVTFGSTTLNSLYQEMSGFLVKYSAAGNCLWAKQSGIGSFNSYCNAYAVVSDEVNNTYVSGWFQDTVNFDSHTVYSQSDNSAFLTKYDTSGNVIWVEQSSTGWIAMSLASDALGHVYMTGINDTQNFFSDSLSFGSYSLYISPTSYSTFIMKFDTSGKPACGSILSGLGDNTEASVASDSTGNYVYCASIYQDSVICGPDTLRTYLGYPNAFLGRWQSCANNTGMNELKVESGELKVYPNPFSNTTTISIIDNGQLTMDNYLELDDITGRTLKSIEFTGNSYTLSAEGLAKGMYFIRVFGRGPTGNYDNCIGTSKIVVQ